MRPEAAAPPRRPSFSPPRRAAPARRPRRAACAAILLCLGSTALPAPAADSPRLEALRRELDVLDRALKADRVKLDDARREAAALATRIAAAAARQDTLKHRIASRQARVDALSAEHRALDARATLATAALAQHTAAHYAMLVQPRLKLLLNQADLQHLGRHLAYADYLFAVYRRERALAARTAQDSAHKAAALRLETEALRRLRQETANHLVALQETEAQHAALLRTLDGRIDAATLRQRELREDEQRLLALVETLAPPAASSAPAGTDKGFAALAGQLTWPVAGEIASAAGGAMREGGAHWAGVLIAARAESEVKAVAAGEIVFAGSFRKLGELVVIDHGAGYLTLYGNTTALRLAPGARVDAGTVIGQVAASSGERPQGLYFELRADGVPLDPRRWCVAR